MKNELRGAILTLQPRLEKIRHREELKVLLCVTGPKKQQIIVRRSEIHTYLALV